MENSFVSLIDAAASVLVVVPAKPNFDQVAAALSLYLSIHDRKEVSIFCSSPMTVGFNRLIGINKVSTELGNKNLVIKFGGYDATNIDKVSYDIENGEFKLTVSPKTGFTAPGKDQVITSYAGISADLVILVGGASDSDFPVLASPEIANSKIAHVGIRVLDSQKGVLSFAKPGATNSELIASLIKENGLTLDTDSATNLIMGIEEGSSNFASNEVTPETFEIFAFLLRNGGRRMPKIKLSPMGFPPGSVPTKPFEASRGKQVLQADTNLEQTENKEEVVENPPSDWLQPKIYKGTPVS
jgi:hypothetical protein